MNKDKILDFCDQLKKRADEICGCEYEIYAQLGDSFSVKVVDGEIEEYSVNDYIGISFRVKYEGKMGYSSTTSLELDGIDELINNAKNNAKIIESADEQFIFEGSKEYKYPKIYSDEIEKISAAQKIEIAKKLEKTALDFDEKIVRTMGSCVFSENGIRIIKNSHGLDLNEQGNIIGAYVMPIAKIGEEMNSGFGFRVGYDADCIKFDEIVKEACEDAIDFCTASSIPASSMRAIINSHAMCDLLETFLSVFSAEQAQRGISMLAGKEGEKIAGDCVNIVDNALEDYGYGSRAFDSEGVASRCNTVVENGVLKTLLYNLKTAAKAGVDSTANASKGSYSSPIGISGTNFIIKSSEYTVEELMKEMKDGIMITSVAGLHSGANAATGDFSLSAQGYMIKDGKKENSVKGITVTGNFYNLLKDICMVGNDLFRNPFGVAVCSPSVLLKNKISVSGEENA